MNCEKCGLNTPLTKHHYITKEKAMRILEERTGKKRGEIKRRISRRNKIRNEGKTEMLCVQCHNSVHHFVPYHTLKTKKEAQSKDAKEPKL